MIFVNTDDCVMLHIFMCKLQDIVISVNTDDFRMLHTVIFINTDDFVMLHVFMCKLQDIVIFVNTDDCYIVEAHPEQAWDTLVSHEDDLHRFTVSYSVVCVTSELSLYFVYMNCPCTLLCPYVSNQIKTLKCPSKGN